MATTKKKKTYRVESTTGRGRNTVELELEAVKPYLVDKQKENHFVYIDGKYVENPELLSEDTIVKSGAIKTNPKQVGA